MTIAALNSGSEETAPRKTADNTVKHRDGGIGSVVANHRSGGENSVVVTILPLSFLLLLRNTCQITEGKRHGGM